MNNKLNMSVGKVTAILLLSFMPTRGNFEYPSKEIQSVLNTEQKIEEKMSQDLPNQVSRGYVEYLIHLLFGVQQGNPNSKNPKNESPIQLPPQLPPILPYFPPSGGTRKDDNDNDTFDPNKAKRQKKGSTLPKNYRDQKGRAIPAKAIGRNTKSPVELTGGAYTMGGRTSKQSTKFVGKLPQPKAKRNGSRKIRK